MNNPRLRMPIDGIVLVNKSQGLSSNGILQKVKHLFNAEKAGHTGSLDPLATGMLPICFGEATKCSQYVLDSDKTYLATGLLGIKTSTADALGEPIACVADFTVEEKALRAVIDSFLGTTFQTPSMYSALKHKGKPLYAYARKGVTVDRPPRPIHVHEITLLAWDGRSFSLRITCSKGTYIRNIVEDIGERLGVGAHVTQLHREYTSGFKSYPMVTVEALESMHQEQRMQCLLPLDTAVACLPPLSLSEHEARALRQGKVVNVSSGNDPGLYRLYAANDLMGFGVLDDLQLLRAQRLFRF